MRNPRVNKRQLEQDRKARADRKRQRKLDRSSEPETEEDVPERAVVDQDATLSALAELHRAYDAETISFDDFEAAKADLMSQLNVD